MFVDRLLVDLVHAITALALSSTLRLLLLLHNLCVCIQHIRLLMESTSLYLILWTEHLTCYICLDKKYVCDKLAYVPVKRGIC